MAVAVVVAFFHWTLAGDQAAGLGFTAYLDRHVWSAMTWGILGGGLYIFVLRKRLRHLPFLPAFGVIAALVLLVVPALHVARAHVDAAQVLQQPEPWADALYHIMLFGGTMLAVRLYEQYGGPTFLLGGYSRPRQELRVFMFLDMRSSTTIAEAIGDTRYFGLLNDLYADITDPVVDSGGNIYQYVGDEVSVSWPLHRGARNARCLRCFFAIQEKLQRRAPYYAKRYGSAPVFKAGFHYGQVTTGEVGLVKKQVIYSGDVVNTTAHIQARCNEFGVENLVSKDLLDLMALPADRWALRPIGSIPLKGKRNTVELTTVTLLPRKA